MKIQRGKILEFRQWYMFEDDARETYRVLLTKAEFEELSIYLTLYPADRLLIKHWEQIDKQELYELIA